ncbi:hypothetical protein PVAP13_1NG065101 [Panicum virgatum]|uniref:Uncharacterized protein n=1 Tax=Panicum virgatum TaxID=38727 RepID=A0A8T0WUH7_PANVG|nr:hypothetical protein PVAP13_1NG065101 [Panicum virgatum]
MARLPPVIRCHSSWKSFGALVLGVGGSPKAALQLGQHHIKVLWIRRAREGRM